MTDREATTGRTALTSRSIWSCSTNTAVEGMKLSAARARPGDGSTTTTDSSPSSVGRTVDEECLHSVLSSHLTRYLGQITYDLRIHILSEPKSQYPRYNTSHLSIATLSLSPDSSTNKNQSTFDNRLISFSSSSSINNFLASLTKASKYLS